MCKVEVDNDTKITIDKDLTVSDSLIVKAGKTMEVSPNINVTVNGNFFNNGTYNDLGGRLYLRGISLQYIRGIGIYNLFRVFVYNTIGVRIERDLTISDTLCTHAGGRLDLAVSGLNVDVEGDVINDGTLESSICTTAPVKPRLRFRGAVSRRFRGSGTTNLCKVEVQNPDLIWDKDATVSDSLTIATGGKVTLGNNAVARLNGNVYNRGGLYDGTAGTTRFGGSGSTRLVTGTKGPNTQYNFGKVRKVGGATTCLRYPVRIADSLEVESGSTLEIAPVADTTVIIDIEGDVKNDGTITSNCVVSLPRPRLRFRGAVSRRFRRNGCYDCLPPRSR